MLLVRAIESGGRYWVGGAVFCADVMQAQGGNTVMKPDGIGTCVVARAAFTSMNGVPCKGIQTGSFLRSFAIVASTNAFNSAVTP
jgi:hypothetical protein